MANLGPSDLDVHPLCLGGNVFGWTADRDASFAVLDAYAAAGGNFIDTAAGYSAWVPGNQGGESETIIGEWLAARGNRDAMVVATKIRDDLSPESVRRRAQESAQRLQTDVIDLFYIHYDAVERPMSEILAGFDALVQEGLVRYNAFSNITNERLREALEIIEREGYAPYVAWQPHYNLVEREPFESEQRPIAEQAGLAVLPYWALASGFLSGKYRPGQDVDSPRAGQAGRYLEDPRAQPILEALDDISTAHETTVAAVALAWLTAQPSVFGPVASARSVEQLAGLLPFADLALSADELRRLDEVSAP
jgi:aryl-alcohol dehydrogenase-like predicted oxidoreductase